MAFTCRLNINYGKKYSAEKPSCAMPMLCYAAAKLHVSCALLIASFTACSWRQQACNQWRF